MRNRLHCLGVVLPLAFIGAAHARAAETTWLPDEVQGDYTILFEVPPPADWPEDGSVRVVFDYRDTDRHHAAVLSRQGVRLERVVGPEAQPLGQAGSWPELEGRIEVSIKRRSWLVEALVNGRSVALGRADEPQGGRIGIELTNMGLSPDDLVVQPTEPPRFTDDFMRSADEESPWTAKSGQWHYVGLAGGKGQLRPDLSANPFSIRCSGTEESLATAGEWFWDSYRVSVAAKAASAGGEIGLAFCVQDERNYYLLALDDRRSEAARPVRLAKVVNGTETPIVATIGGYETDVWQRIEARVSDGLVEGYIDGRLVLSASDRTFGQGKIGCWGRGLEAEWFDDVDVSPWWGYTDPLTARGLPDWLQAGGHWMAGNGSLQATSSFEEPGTILVGGSQWRDYEVGADVTVADADAVGLYACADGTKSWYLFRWARGTPVGTWQLLRMAQGQPTALAVVPGDLQLDAPQHMSISVARGLVDCRVGDAPVITVADAALQSGQAGLRAEGGRRARFASITFRSVDEPYRRTNITKQFTEEDTMADWARSGSDWQLDAETDTRWFRLPLFHDASVRFPFRLASSQDGRLTLRMGTAMRADGLSGASGPQSAGLDIEFTTLGDDRLGVACRRGETVVGQTEVAGGTSRVARIDKVGPTLRVWIDDEPALAVNDGTWLENSAVGITAGGTAINPNQIEIYSTHMPEYTFSGAPTDWRPTLGVWQVTDRWSCFPGWAWFGGSKHESPLLWSKRQLFGDQTFEFWAGLEMDTEPRFGGYTHPSDINCTIAGDGENLCSGYSFVFAGDNNTRTKILKGNTVVAQTDQVHFTDPSTRNMNFHRHWFHVKAVKFGPEVYMAVDGQWVLNWRDPQPLEGGHVAVWSYNNGILIARARASAERVE